MSVFRNNPYYHGITRNFITGFGQLFNGLAIVNYDDSCDKERMIRVPIAYGPKHKWLARLMEQPSLTSLTVKTTLPRLSFEITDIKFDAERKVGTVGSYIPGFIGDARARLFNPVPYNLLVSMYSYTKNNDDALQIMEQILPFFAPTLELKIELFPELNMTKTVPVQLNGVTIDDTYGDSNVQTQRTIIQTFSFTAKLDYFGPITSNSSSIKKINLNYSQSDPFEIDFTNSMEVDPLEAGKDDPHVIKETWEQK